MKDVLNKIEDVWNHFWFQPEPPQALGVCRLLFFGGLFLAFVGTDFSSIPRVAEVLWLPTSFYRFLFPHGPLPATATLWIEVIWKISLLTSAAGLLSRFSTLVAGLLGLYLIGLPYNFGKLDHSMAVAGLVLIMMPFSDCGRVWSADQWIAGWRRRPWRPLLGEEARWPIQFARVAITLLMFSAGLNKLRTSGIPWVTSDTLQNYLLFEQAPVGLWLAQWPLVCHFVAASALFTEFTYPVALISKRLARVWVPTGMAMFTGIHFMMNISFFFLVYLNFFWLPWGRLFRQHPARPGDQDVAA